MSDSSSNELDFNVDKNDKNEKNEKNDGSDKNEEKNEEKVAKYDSCDERTNKINKIEQANIPKNNTASLKSHNSGSRKNSDFNDSESLVKKDQGAIKQKRSNLQIIKAAQLNNSNNKDYNSNRTESIGSKNEVGQTKFQFDNNISPKGLQERDKHFSMELKDVAKDLQKEMKKEAVKEALKEANKDSKKEIPKVAISELPKDDQKKSGLFSRLGGYFFGSKSETNVTALNDNNVLNSEKLIFINNEENLLPLSSFDIESNLLNPENRFHSQPDLVNLLKGENMNNEIKSDIHDVKIDKSEKQILIVESPTHHNNEHHKTNNGDKDNNYNKDNVVNNSNNDSKDNKDNKDNKSKSLETSPVNENKIQINNNIVININNLGNLIKPSNTAIEVENNMLSSNSNYVMEPMKDVEKTQVIKEPEKVNSNKSMTGSLINKDKDKDKDSNNALDNVENKSNNNNFLSQIELSNCLDKLLKNKDLTEEIFYDNTINKEEFYKDPWKILNNQNVVIRYNDSIYTVKAAIPLIVSILAFNQEPPEEVMKSLLKNQEGGFFSFFSSKKNDNEIIKIDLKKKRPHSLSEYNGDTTGNNSPKSEFMKSDLDEMIKIHIKNENEIIETASTQIISTNNNYSLKSLKKRNSVKPKRTKTPSSDLLKRLNLKEGKNTISFTVTSRFQGEHTIGSEIYLWNHDSKIIISDVDGTITRSDILGHIFPIFGKDWSHTGVTELYSNIEKNGYKFLYLTARALCQSYTTQNYLKTLKQNNINLPNGPILMSSDGLVSSFKREVIDKQPQVKFIIIC